jgi:hypothetical protein
MITKTTEFSLKTEMLNLMNQIHIQTKLLKQNLREIVFVSQTKQMEYSDIQDQVNKIHDYVSNL